MIESIITKIYSLFITFFLKIPQARYRPYVNKIVGGKYFKIGKKVRFGKGAILTAWDKYHRQVLTPSVSIGDNCCFGDFLHLTAINSIEIGDNILTGRWVTITDNAHGQTDFESLNIPPIDRYLISKGSVRIKNNVWIGDKVTILPGVTIGEGCIIGANSVVTTEIPNYSIACGNPAKVIRTRTHE